MTIAPPPSPRKINIPLVDDRAENLVALRSILDRSDYNLVSAQSGPEALGWLLREDFALILLDIYMPIMDGYEVATAIKKREKTKHIPIIFLTAMAREVESIYKAYHIGAVDYIQKPLEPAVVQAKVAVFADLHRKTLQIKRQGELLRRIEIREKDLELSKIVQAQEKKYQELVEGLENVIVWSADVTDFSFSYVSPQAEALLGFSLSQWREEKDFFLNQTFHEDRTDLIAQIEKARNGENIEFEHRIMTSTGNFVWYHTGIRLTKKDHEQGEEFRGLSVNINTLKTTEEALREAVRMRDEFLSIASHELKTPITPLKLQIQMLMRTLRNPDAAVLGPPHLPKTIHVLHRQIERLTTVIESLLDVSRISTGRLILTPEELDLSALLKTVMHRFADQMAQLNCEVKFKCEPGIQGVADRLRVEQVLFNLLSNAFKYGNGKPIEINLVQQEGEAVFQVRDHGIGIKKEDQDRVFNRFERAVSITHFGGLGLGLYVTRQIVQAHGGSIVVESNPREGTTFCVKIPLHPSPDAHYTHSNLQIQTLNQS